jgi:glyoxylase-like metal-dependent hydrolase (beta-lactamase superfamily II)
MPRDVAARATPVDLGGGVTVTALTDALADHRRPLEECFPGMPADGWDAVKRAYSETVSPDGKWRLPMNAFLVRTPDATVLVDTGVGTATTVAAGVFQTVGHLPDLLPIKAADVDAVVFTHLHSDHLGWAADPETGEPTFPNARYVVVRTEWESLKTTEPVKQSLERLRPELIEPSAVVDGVEAVALPGHTPGHCAWVITGAATRAALVGDAFNHPHQVAEPEIPSIADVDRDQAIATRHAIIERATSGEWPVLGSAHHPGAWWDVADGPVWRSRA